MNNPIFIAGGTGYISSHANKILNKRGFEIQPAEYYRNNVVNALNLLDVMQDQCASGNDGIYVENAARVL